jgi:hypothetical protein
MTKLASRKKGYASALMNWATQLADDLNYPCYLGGGGGGMGVVSNSWVIFFLFSLFSGVEDSDSIETFACSKYF